MTADRTLCEGREPLTRRQADDVVKRAKFRGAATYRCVVCGHWHVGASNRALVPRRRRG